MAIATLGKSLNLLDGRYFPGGTKQNTSNAIADTYFGGKTQGISRQFQFDAGIVYDMSKFVDGLSFKTLFSIDYAADYSLSYNNKYAVYIPTWSNYNIEDAIVAIKAEGKEVVTGTMSMSNTKYRQTISWNGHFDYDHTFGGKHHVTGLFLGNMYTTTTSGQYHCYTNVNLGLQAGYDYMSRYFAEVGLAGVHSARLPEGNREALSYSFTLGWNLAKEKFLKNTFVDDLLLSASYSNLKEDADVYLGNKQFYIYEASWGTTGSSTSWGEGKSADRTYSSAGSNPDLDFVKRKEFSMTLRGSFFNKLISTELTYFNTDISGLIIDQPTIFPSHLSNGLSSATFRPAINNNVQNRRGLDFSITAQKQFGDVHVQLGLVGTYLKTEWKTYDEKVDNTSPQKNTEGRALDVIWGYKCQGFYDVDDFIIGTDKDGKTTYTLKDGLPKPSLGGSVQPGDLKYEDVSGGPNGEPDGKITNKDMVELGTSGAYGAPWSIGLNLTLKYKNWTLFMLGRGQFGAYDMLNGNSYYFMSGNAKYSVNARGRWTPETAETATHPRLTASTTTSPNSLASTFWMYSTDRFNLSKVQLTYDFPKEMFDGKWVKALSVYVNANDLLTISKNRKIMETTIGGQPQTRFYNIGVKVTL